MTTQSESNTLSTEDGPFEDLLIVGTGKPCPAEGYWVVKGQGGRGKTYYHKGEEFRQYRNQDVDWQGPSER